MLLHLLYLHYMYLCISAKDLRQERVARLGIVSCREHILQCHCVCLGIVSCREHILQCHCIEQRNRMCSLQDTMALYLVENTFYSFEVGLCRWPKPTWRNSPPHFFIVLAFYLVALPAPRKGHASAAALFIIIYTKPLYYCF